MERWARESLSYWVAVILVLFLSGCNNENNDLPLDGISGGGSGAGQSGEIILSLQDSAGNTVSDVTSGEAITITSQFLDDNTPLTGLKIEFTASAGALSSPSRLTDQSGTAVVVFESSDLPPGVVVLTASAEYNGETITKNVEVDVLANGGNGQGALALAMSLVVNGESSVVVEENNSAQLRVRVVDTNNLPLQNTAVSFSVDLGSLNSSSDLTDSNGFAEVTLTGQEGVLGVAKATASVTVNNITYTEQLSYQIVEAGSVSSSKSVSIGYFDDNDEFVKDTIQTDFGATTISAGATLGLSLTLVDQDFQPILVPSSVSFTSTCIRAGQASIDSPVETINGIATSTYKDISCASASGNTDDIIATVTTGSETLTATTTIDLQAEKLGSIEFLSSLPDSIVLKGTGGAGKQETSVLSFLVKGELGNPLRQQKVTFDLNTNVGGLSLAATTGVTDVEGKVTAKVIAGTVPTVVRVKAVAENVSESGETVTINTQSDLLSLNTGLPDQDSFTLALDVLNPEARNHIGEQVKASVFLADSFNNPVPDGTTVNFTSEGGAIQPFCNTVSGSCSVTWTSQNPFPIDHRVTILATAEGHESFVDTDGDNVFSINDGSTGEDGSINDLFDSIQLNSANLSRTLAGFSSFGALISEHNTLRDNNTIDSPFGYLDMPEAWRDDNENYQYDIGELFIDSSQNGLNEGGSFSERDKKFNGPQCEEKQGSTVCSDKPFVTIRKSAILITSSSNALYRLINRSNGTVVSSNFAASSGSGITINRGSAAGLQLEVCDTAFQIMPFGTKISAATDIGEVSGFDEFTVPNSRGGSASGIDINDCQPNGTVIPFSLKNTLSETDDPESGSLSLVIETPKGVKTTLTVGVSMLITQ